PILRENELFPRRSPVPDELLFVREQKVGFAVAVHVGNGHAVADFYFGIYIHGAESGLRRLGAQQRQGAAKYREKSLCVHKPDGGSVLTQSCIVQTFLDGFRASEGAERQTRREARRTTPQPTYCGGAACGRAC